MPIGTNVEIISQGNIHNGKRGAFKSKTQDGLMVQFDNGESDYFKDDEVVPIQNIIMIDNLEYETLCKVFDIRCFYETDIIVVKQKKFPFDEIEKAYVKHCNVLASWANGTYEIKEEEDFDTEYREDIIGLLGRMLQNNDGGTNAVGETIMWEQWWIKGLRSHCTKASARSKLRYFNPEAKIETIFI